MAKGKSGNAKASASAKPRASGRARSGPEPLETKEMAYEDWPSCECDGFLDDERPEDWLAEVNGEI
ncbi:MAG: hypothetical protein HYY16_03215 [Planctomycetes bacterium]|nr:hypothetical protein [Planctomycetota bacterium]